MNVPKALFGNSFSIFEVIMIAALDVFDQPWYITLPLVLSIFLVNAAFKAAFNVKD